MDDWQIEYWLSDVETNRIPFFSYWNDEEKEKDKKWHILDGNFSKMEEYLEEIGLPCDLKQCVGILKTRFRRSLGGIGIDLATGNGWAVPYLMDLGRIDRLYCLEYSKHRLLKLAPKVLEHYQVKKEKVILALGSFYDLHLVDHSLDFAFLSSAFHHADEPERLLAEIKRVLKPDGVVIIIGEHVIDYPLAWFKNLIKIPVSFLIPAELQKKMFGKKIKSNNLFPKPSSLFPADPILGDHYYTGHDYRKLFSMFGFNAMHLRRKASSTYQSFVLVRK